MGELSSALDSLAADDLHEMFGPQLLERLGGLLRIQNRIAAEIARTVRECDLTGAAEFDGLKSMASWLRGHGHLSGGAAAQLVRTARALEHLPAVATAFADGDVTAAQAGVVAQVATPERLAEAVAQDVDLEEIDRALARVAVEQPFDQLVAVVRYYREALDPDGDDPDPTEGRRLSFPARFGSKRSCRRGAARATGGRGGSSLPTRWCSSPTTRWPPVTCRSIERSSPTSWSPSARPT